MCAVAEMPGDAKGWFQLAVESRQNEELEEAYDAVNNE